jgi:PHD/YefM family antitoxin component YafN of YafNO toxin-antitoxin module
MAHFAGLLNDAEYEAEQKALRDLIERELASGREHMRRYLARWDELRAGVQSVSQK